MSDQDRELQILQEIERNPDVTQAGLATQLGVAVGKVNWYIKRLVNKGYVKVTRLQRRKLHYFLTPAGLALKLKLTQSYMQVSLRTYRELRQAAQHILAQVRQAGYTTVHIQGNDEAAEILRLTCLEQDVKVNKKSTGVPTLYIEGTDFVVAWPKSGPN
jgi:DNA-binding MarR family transcriptional regulator